MSPASQPGASSEPGSKPAKILVVKMVGETKELPAAIAELMGFLDPEQLGSCEGFAVAATSLLANLPPVLSPDEVAELLRVDVKVVYAAVAELGLPMRPIGRRKCLRGLTIAILLWLVGQWVPDDPAALESSGQGRVVPKRKGRR